MESTLRRTWSEINLDALKFNYEKIREKTGKGVKFLGVVKADAYGHGSIAVAKTLEESGADYLVTTSRRMGDQVQRKEYRCEKALEKRDGTL